MTYVATFVDPVFVVQWCDEVRDEEPQRLSDEADAHRDRVGHLLHLVVVIPNTLPIPAAATRRAANGLTTRLLERDCATIDVVIEGPGVVGDMLRTIVRGVSVATRRRDRVFVHDDLSTALMRICDQTPSRVAAVLDAVRVRC